MEYSVIIGYVVGTLFGLYFGYHRGMTHGIVKTMDHLIQGNFLKAFVNEDGEIELEALPAED